MPTQIQKFIVAEVTKNWRAGTPISNLICQQFESVINTNLQRGYKLVDWKLCVAGSSELLTETIVAIFESIE